MSSRTNTATWYEKHKRWQIKVQKDGVRRTFTSSKAGRTGQREANSRADEWLEQGVVSRSARSSSLYEGYLESLKLRYSKAGWEKEDYFWRCHISPAIGNKKISSVNELELQRIVDVAYKKGLSKKTLKGIASFIRSFFRYCRRANATTLEPELSIPKNATEKAKQILQPRDLFILLNVDETIYRGKRVFDDNIFAYRIAVLTGLRPGELRHLKWKDIDGDTINVRGSVNVDNEVTDGKNQNAIRSFKMIALAQAVLENYKKHIIRWHRNDFIFDLPPYPTFYKQWRRYCASNGIPEISLYEMRHSFVSIAKRLEEGMVKPLVGHAKDMDTFGVYGHQLDGDDAVVADELNAVFDKVLEYGKTQVEK